MKDKWYIGCFNKSVIITYIGVCAITLGSISIIKYDNLKISIMCLIVAGICDLFDGMVARKCKRTEIEKQFGIELDSLADIVNFGVYPLIIIINMNRFSIILSIVCMTYIVSGINRLAWFNINTNYKEFHGIPITSVVLILATDYVISIFFGKELFKILSILSLGILSLLFSLNIKIHKQNKTTYIVMSILAILYTVIIIIYGY